jgi:hypothetical protein
LLQTSRPDVTAKTVRKVLVENASTNSYLMTDDATIYFNIGKEFYGHSTTDHSKRQYVKAGGSVHSSRVLLRHLKRRINGSFHSVSEKHLQCYVDEFAFRWKRARLAASRISSAPTTSSRLPRASVLRLGGLTKLRTLKQKARHFLRWRRGVIGS